MSVRGKGAHNGVSRAFGNVRGLGRAFLYLSIYEPSFITRADRAARRAAMLCLFAFFGALSKLSGDEAGISLVFTTTMQRARSARRRGLEQRQQRRAPGADAGAAAAAEG